MGRMMERLRENSYDTLIWIMNLNPTIIGFSFLGEIKWYSVIFWIIHFSLLFYLYIVGIFDYLMYRSKGWIDIINSIFNLPISVLEFIAALWFIFKRKTIIQVIELSDLNDKLLVDSIDHLDQYRKMLRTSKIILLTCYVFHLLNDVFIFIPSRIFIMDSFSITSCVGMNLTTSPSKEICMTMLTFQELTSVLIVSGYDAIILLFSSHIAAIFEILHRDTDDFVKGHQINLSSNLIDKKLKSLIRRHESALRTVALLEDTFSAIIGMDFVLNVVSLCLFCVLPIEVCLNYGPLIYYYASVFFLYCYQGQKLTNASEKFEIAVYCCGWEGLNTRQQKMVLCMLLQAQKPVRLHAARIIPLCMSTFAITAQNIYKFVTIFKV